MRTVFSWMAAGGLALMCATPVLAEEAAKPANDVEQRLRALESEIDRLKHESCAAEAGTDTSYAGKVAMKTGDKFSFNMESLLQSRFELDDRKDKGTWSEDQARFFVR